MRDLLGHRPDHQGRTNKPALSRCELDGSACMYIDLSDGQGAMSGTETTAVIDTAGQRILTVTNDGATGNTSALFRLGLW
jgi:hypothetical protein